MSDDDPAVPEGMLRGIDDVDSGATLSADELASLLDDQDPESIRQLARRVHEIADTKMVKQLEAGSDRDDTSDEVDEDFERDDLDRDEAPARATLTTKTIHDNDYYYWQWREGDTIKSEYIKPVNPDE